MKLALVYILGLIAHGIQCLFSIHDDLLAIPQYEIEFPEAFVPIEPVQFTLPESSNRNHLTESYELLQLKDKRNFLCTIPQIKHESSMNATEKELSRVEEEKELARATSRGWELLSDLDGKCLYFVSGWWSYSFCYNREVRQFHQLPPQHNNQWPPTEDAHTQSYVLGKVSMDSSNHASTGLQTSGELRYLVQRLGGGTICDLTGKDRKIEVQFHCNSHGTDRIDWIKEVSICCYLMIIYTPRLCNDATFLPRGDNIATAIDCREVLVKQDQREFYKVKVNTVENFQNPIHDFIQTKLDSEVDSQDKKQHKKNRGVEDMVYYQPMF